MVIITIEHPEADGPAITVTGGDALSQDRREVRPGESARIAIKGPAQLSLSAPGAPKTAKGEDS